MGLGGAVIAALSTVICLKVPFSDGLGGGISVFDSITKDDLIMAFFPCIHFCDAKVMMFKGVHLGQKSWSS